MTGSLHEKKFKICRFLLVLILLSFIPLVVTMGFFDSMKVSLFSEMKGVVLCCSKVNLLRVQKSHVVQFRIMIKSTKIVISDSTGHFQFGRMETHLFLKLLPVSISVHQKVFIEYNGQKYMAWITSNSGKYKNELNELNDIGTNKEISIDIKCELTAKEHYRAGASATTIKGICSWLSEKILE